MIKTKIELNVPAGKKVYFTSDWHLGYPNYSESFKREQIILKWLKEIEKDAYALFLLGDIFDFWYDYKYAASQNFVRILGQLASIADSGIKIFYFFGNHDMWHEHYLEKEIGMQMVTDDAEVKLNDLAIYAAHGDGLGAGDKTYKLLKKLFRNPLARWAFRWLHPDLGIPLAGFFSHTSRNHSAENISEFLGADKERLILYSQEILKTKHFDYFIFGHRHHMVTHALNPSSTYINLGDWVKWYSYAEFDGEQIQLKKYPVTD